MLNKKMLFLPLHCSSFWDDTSRYCAVQHRDLASGTKGANSIQMPIIFTFADLERNLPFQGKEVWIIHQVNSTYVIIVYVLL